MRPQDSVKQRNTQLLNIKEQLRSKVDSLRKELEGKRRNKLDSEQSNDQNDQPPILTRFDSAVNIWLVLVYIGIHYL